MTNHQGHIKLWDELARTGTEDKGKVFVRLFSDDAIGFAWFYSCFACEESHGVCQNCPIEWKKGERGNCCHKGSYYSKWMEARSTAERKRLAAIIRDLPWRERT